MLKIFICEDSDIQRKRFLNIVEDCIEFSNYNMEVALETGNPKELINHVRNNDEIGIYFLDVDLKADINGIELATEIRKYDPRGFIVFVTTHGEMSYLTFKYKVEAMDYIVKEDYKELKPKIRQCLEEACNKLSDKRIDDKIFSVKVGDKIIKIPFNKILFFETSTFIRKIVLHGENRYIEFIAQMKDVEEKLDSRFYRCHKSYIVNKDNIEEIDVKKRIIYMKNGEECLVSIRHMKNLIGD